ncbi:class II fructose-bisphosphate aldolase [Herbiconiux sp. KACC 21604]|uniref:class II fructose-bisphosphate aldolase n=1 Tax=unclassified Herbiconiux TaxID=2618217 RepID=UPI001490A9D1|nr:class II fructose-bisphosphate aldolase [Herbiconiux sp. SALV-R1]QJU54765.1 fructose-bisphosphate aldolase [Herbiconiux sp. SALV-R1]WPO85874.1 class II fructose-bisphosphate aldolase [Herbiconiux sp. KACC 21604]
MTLAGAAALITDAEARGRAVPAFNVVSLEQAEAVVGGAEDAGVPVLLQVSQNAIVWHGGFAPLLAACRELAVAASLPIGLHVDHVEDAELARSVIERAAELGVGSIMFDAARLDDDANTELTARVAELGHDHGLWVEGELGEVGGKNGAHAPGVRTAPGDAGRYVAATGVDGLAVAVGSEHAMTDRSAKLDLDLIVRLRRAVDVPLVLHGSSGVPDEALRASVAAGIRKVNVGTALGVEGTARLRAELAARPDAVDPRGYTGPVRDSTRRLVAHLADVVG